MMCAAGALAAVFATPSHAKSCTHEIKKDEIDAGQPIEFTCGGVGVKLMPLVSEMYYHRWSGEVIARAVGGDATAQIALAAFDNEGQLIGVHSVFERDLGARGKSIPIRMDGMYTSVTDTQRILLSVSLPNLKGK